MAWVDVEIAIILHDKLGRLSNHCWLGGSSLQGTDRVEDEGTSGARYYVVV